MSVHKRLLLCGLVLWAVTACSRVDRDHYAQLKTGQTPAAVEAILGRADYCDDLLAGRRCTWGDARRHIQVTFVGDRVVLYTASGLN